MSKRLWLMALMLLSAAFNGCAKAPPHERSFVPMPANSFTVAWPFPLKLEEKDKVESLHVSDELLVAYTASHKSVLLNRKAGTLLSQIQVNQPRQKLRAPVVLADRIVFGTSEGLDVYSLTGKKIRSVTFPQSIHSNPAGAGNYVYVGIDYQSVARLLQIDISKTVGVVRWEAMTKAPMLASPVQFQSLVYFTSTDGLVYCLSEERSLAWAGGGVFRASGSITADLKVDEYGLYVASEDSKLYCLSRTSGKIRWQYYGGNPLHDAPAPTAGLVYQHVDGKGVVCVDKLNGLYNRAELWAVQAERFLAEDEKCAFLLRVEEVAGKKVNTILAVDKKKGQIIFKSQRTDLAVFGQNLGKDGTIYAATTGGEILAIKANHKAGHVGELAMEDRPIEILAAAE